MSERFKNCSEIEEIDWHSWSPVDYATLIFYLKHNRVLLIRKKRGLGQGKINAPGGRLEQGETSMSAALRECQEDVGLTPENPTFIGDHRFQFSDGYSMHVFVYRCESATGELIETAEALPIWFDQQAIPYSEMWADDILWVPLLLEETPFQGRYIFRGDEMIAYELNTCPPFSPER